jgi:hypothetical protein
MAAIPTRKPNVARSMNSPGRRPSSASIGRRRKREAATETVTNTSALATATRVGLTPSPPAAAKPSTPAMTTSSKTRIARMRSVSSSARRRKSMRPLTVTALEET